MKLMVCKIMQKVVLKTGVHSIMPYGVRIEFISQDVPDVIQTSILLFLKTYDFPYVSSVQDKLELRSLFLDHFTNRKSLDSLVGAIKNIASKPQYATSVAWTETNRIHTAGFANMLKSKDQTKCKAIHTYGETSMNSTCMENLEGRILDIDTVLANTFPESRIDILKKDVPMIPQHVNCRHVMSPIDEFQL